MGIRASLSIFSRTILFFFLKNGEKQKLFMHTWSILRSFFFFSFLMPMLDQTPWSYLYTVIFSSIRAPTTTNGRTTVHTVSTASSLHQNDRAFHRQAAMQSLVLVKRRLLAFVFFYTYVVNDSIKFLEYGTIYNFTL